MAASGTSPKPAPQNRKLMTIYMSYLSLKSEWLLSNLSQMLKFKHLVTRFSA